jgi:hypothetical protein
MNIPVPPRAWQQFFRVKILQFFDADPNPRSGIFLTLDPGYKMEIRIRDLG